MVLFQLKDILLILAFRKIATCRHYKLKIGNEYKCNLGLLPYFARIRITKCYKVDIRKLTHEEILKLGFQTRKDYLKESYSDSENPIKYYHEFELIENNIQGFLESYKKDVK